VIGAVNRLARDEDYALTAAGGLPGELNVNWLSKGVATFDCEYGYSCMGYEISGAWGAKLARPAGDVIAFAGDGSYLMLNTDLYSSVITGQKLIVVVCDNGGFAVIDRLQTGMGGRSFNNMFDNTGPERVKVDWAAHAIALGCRAEAVETIAGLEEAFERARSADRTTVIAIETAPDRWTPGGAFWEVGVAEVSERAEVRAAHERVTEAKHHQRVGW
jgi:3D-(3,5/4)-trihydroxycyclohexane-1,2-dione acylhydrolase (decyclizing)